MRKYYLRNEEILLYSLNNEFSALVRMRDFIFSAPLERMSYVVIYDKRIYHTPHCTHIYMILTEYI